jgi:hypothetical protein
MSFFQVFGLFLTLCIFTLILKDNMSLRSHRTEEVMVYFFFVFRSGSVLMITDPDPDPSGPTDPTYPDPEHCWKLKISQHSRVVRVCNCAMQCAFHISTIDTIHIGVGHGFAGGGLPYYKVLS